MSFHIPASSRKQVAEFALNDSKLQTPQIIMYLCIRYHELAYQHKQTCSVVLLPFRNSDIGSFISGFMPHLTPVTFYLPFAIFTTLLA